jgi:hypothetical protein
MNTIKYLEQAKLADSLGKYKLADSFYEKAIRLAAIPPVVPIFVEIAELGAREAAEAALQAALREGNEAVIRQALRDRGFTEAGIEALEKAQGSLRRINITNVNTAIAESGAGAFERAANVINIPGRGSTKLDASYNLNQLEELLREPLSARDKQTLIKFIRRYLNRKRSETISDEFAREINHNGIDYTKPRPEPTRPPAPESETPRPSETPSETPLEELPEGEAGEGLFEKIKSRFRRKPSEELTELPKQKSKVMKWAKILGATGLAALGLYLYKDKLVDKNGKEINYFDVDLNKLGLPDDTMYKARMEAGQQQPQEPKALAFIEKNKDNAAIKDQRDWYNLALQEYKKENSGKDFDKTDQWNFANDVVAIIKKSDKKTRGFDAGRNA